MDQKYQRYTVADFSQDPKFINWVKNDIDKQEWEDFLNDNPSQVKAIETARKIVDSFRFGETSLSEEEVQVVWRNVVQYYHQNKRSKRNLFLTHWAKYAAILVVALAVAAVTATIFLRDNDFEKYFSAYVSPSPSNDAKLILSGGREIVLKQNHSNLQFSANGKQITINKDSVITDSPQEEKEAMTQIIIPYGKRSDVVLSDGSRVKLNAGSSLIFPQKFIGKERKVFLKGKGYFSVAKNKEKPFVVASSDANITVLGTEFNVSNDNPDNDLVVVLVEGSVRIKENGKLNYFGKEVVMKPNEKATYRQSDHQIQIESDVDVSFYTSWKDGVLKFQKESILNVFDELSKFYNVTFIPNDDVELSRRVGGKLDLKDSLEDVMKVISDAALISFRIDNDKVYVSRKLKEMPMK